MEERGRRLIAPHMLEITLDRLIERFTHYEASLRGIGAEEPEKAPEVKPLPQPYSVADIEYHQLYHVYLIHYLNGVKGYVKAFESETKKLQTYLSSLLLKETDLRKVYKAMVKKVTGIKNRLHSVLQYDEKALHTLHSRLQYLYQADISTSPQLVHAQRFQRILVEHFMAIRSPKMVVALKDPALSDIVDEDAFRTQQDILDKLEKNDTTPALQWLQRSKEHGMTDRGLSIRLKLHIYQMNCILSQEGTANAYAFMQSHITPFLAQYPNREYHVMARTASQLLFLTEVERSALPHVGPSLSEVYREMKDLFALAYGTVDQTMLEITLAAGLCLQWRHNCSQSNHGPSNRCITCIPAFGEMAAQLPRPSFSRSQIVCPISKKCVDNVMVLPTGSALSPLLYKHCLADGHVTCPLTHQTIHERSVKKGFIV